MKIKKKALILVGVTVGVIAIGIVYFALRNNDDVEFVLEKVERGKLIQTVDTTGELESIDEVDLSFEAIGVIEEIFVSIGESVEAGDVIAKLDSSELEASVRSAGQAYAIAKASLDLEVAGVSSESVAVFQADVEVARVALQSAKITLQNTIDNQLNAVSTAKLNMITEETDLANVLLDSEQETKDTKNDYINALKSAMITVRALIADADEVLGIENTIINDDYEVFLSAINKNYLNLANQHFNLSITKRDLYEPVVFGLDSESSLEEVESAADSVESVLELTSLTLLYTRQVLDATTASTSDFSTADLLALKTSIDSARVSVHSESTFIAPKQAYENSKIDVGIAIDSAESVLAVASLAYSTALTTQSTAVSAAETTVAQRNADAGRAEAALNEVLAAPRNVDLAGLKAEVSRTFANLDQTKVKLENTKITSPITGVLTDFTLSVGEQAVVGQIVATVQSTDDMFQVSTNVAESDIVKISTEDKVIVVLDAYGDDSPIYGYISSINPAEQNIEGVIFYEAIVFLEENAYLLDLKPGMSADVEVSTAELEDVLFVPQRAVLEDDIGNKFVRIPNGNEFEKRIVKTGLRADGGRLEITEGLVEGEEIILTIR